jgi:hypothetical protein
LQLLLLYCCCWSLLQLVAQGMLGAWMQQQLLSWHQLQELPGLPWPLKLLVLLVQLLTWVPLQPLQVRPLPLEPRHCWLSWRPLLAAALQLHCWQTLAAAFVAAAAAVQAAARCVASMAVAPPAAAAVVVRLRWTMIQWQQQSLQQLAPCALQRCCSPCGCLRMQLWLLA